MKRLFALCILAAHGLSAFNYIDNPNFDLGVEGWKSSDGAMVGYVEDLGRQLTAQKFLACTSASYRMLKVPGDVPLHFVAELGYEGATRFSPGITIRIFEVFPIKGTQRTASNLLISKEVLLNGRDRWHSVSSDYPVYKKHANSFLEVTIVNRENSAPIHINYLQVGTDPFTLGGRGPRERLEAPCYSGLS